LNCARNDDLLIQQNEYAMLSRAHHTTNIRETRKTEERTCSHAEGALSGSSQLSETHVVSGKIKKLSAATEIEQSVLTLQTFRICRQPRQRPQLCLRCNTWHR
jgi:hypothetical protein